jgi:hypothetical protein
MSCPLLKLCSHVQQAGLSTPIAHNKRIEEEVNQQATDSFGTSWATDMQGCDSYFGNGFSERTVLLEDDRIVCHRHPVTSATYCVAVNISIDPAQMVMSRYLNEM